MSNRKIFVVGLPGTGKTSFSTKLAFMLGTTVLNAGLALRSYLIQQHVPLGAESEIGHVFIERFGEETVGEEILKETIRTRSRVIDGVRLFSTLTYFNASGIDVDVIYLSVGEQTRRERFCRRAIADSEAQTLEDATMLLARKDVWGADLDRFASVCRWSFDNSGSPEALSEFIGRVVDESSIRRAR